jgi:hypothetical protein
MKGKCSNPDCAAPISCHEGKESFDDCGFWQKEEEAKSKKEPSAQNIEIHNTLPWTGQSLSSNNLNQISIRNAPIVIGVIGKADAGKTTYLAMLFTLLLKGAQLEDYTFAGSKTIQGWDELYHKLKVQKNKVSFPDPTPAQYLRLLHLALRDKQKRLKDVVLSDASGEVFSLWSKNREDVNAENARWIYKSAHALILFIDCVDLINNKNVAKTEIIDLAQMLQHDLKNRPIIAVWSKADRIGEVHPTIKNSLKEELQSLFSNYDEIEISNFSKDDPDILVHQNNIKVLDWVLSKMYLSVALTIPDSQIHSGDYFLNYKGGNQ